MCGNVREQKRPLTTRQYGRLVSNLVGGIGPDQRKFATHSMRRTIGGGNRRNASTETIGPQMRYC
jgi:hypothetical protein